MKWLVGHDLSYAAKDNGLISVGCRLTLLLNNTTYEMKSSI
ncbi:hypothetical protein [Rossellomorea vietnamensis]|nr:hypothetical protein [Rossellomorea vietnamensis]